MNDNTSIGESVRGFSSLIRPHFSPGLLLQDDDLTQGVTYTRALSRLMFRTLFGCGVLCGLKVSPPAPDNCGGLSIGVAKGLALDCVGDPVEVPTPQNLALTCADDVGDELWVALRRIEKCCAPRTAVCSPDDEEPPATCTRERDGYELRVFSERPCSCGCARLLPQQPQNPDPLFVAEGAAAKKGKKTALKTTGGTATKTATEAAGSAAPAAAPAAPPPAAANASLTAHGAHAALAEPPAEPLPESGDCLCNLRTASACYAKHYEGECPCECCDCEWIVLAVANRNVDGVWTTDHSVRRFVRPVLMRDPVVEDERT